MSGHFISYNERWGINRNGTSRISAEGNSFNRGVEGILFVSLPADFRAEPQKQTCFLCMVNKK